MRINHNISSMITQSALYKTHRAQSKTLTRLSTGLRINQASDDAAGLGVSENLRTQVRGMKQALRNTQDAIQLLNIADGALQEQATILQRMRELVIEAKNDTYTETERLYMGQEFSQLMDELDRIAAVTNYNGMQIFATPEQTTGSTQYPSNLGSRETPHKIADARTVWDNDSDAVFGDLDDASAHHFNMMIGANYSDADVDAFNSGVGAQSYDKSASNMITIQLGQIDATGLLALPAFGVNAASLIETNGNAFGWDTGDFFDNLMAGDADLQGDTVQSKLQFLLNVIDGEPDELMDRAGHVTGIERVNTMRAQIGAYINRLEHNVNNLMNSRANQQAAESTIRDTDFATESSKFTKQQILTRSGTSMLAQANMVPQNVLALMN